MKPETLEALLLDRVTGELAPEVVELLETHLTHHPEAAREADQLASTLRLARQAVARTPEVPQQPLAVGHLRRVQVMQRRLSIAWEMARLAACVALGLALGSYGRTRHRASVIAVSPPAANQVAPMIATAETPGGADKSADFWSVSSLTAAQQSRQSVESRGTNRYRLHWDSPVKMPRVEENL
jgi:anti-sigma factor RsiW